VLDAEVGARRFYEAVGFEPRGLSSYVLKTPKGYLLRSIVAMTHRCHTLREDVIQELSKAIVREVKRLRKKPRNQKDLSRRNAALSAVKECVKPETRPEISRAVFLALLKHYKKIPEFMALLPQEAPKEAIDHATSSGR
jgi:hypothetical protein